MTLRWDPSRLNAAVVEGFRQSLMRAAVDARTSSPTPKAGADAVQTSATTGSIVPTGEIGAIVEVGAAPHLITLDPGQVAFLEGADVFVTGTIDHPGSPAKPYIRPAAARWAAGGFHATARPVMAAAGFGA